MIEQFKDGLIRILFGAGCVSLFISFFDDDPSSIYEGASILLACIFLVYLQTASEYAKNRQYLSLHDAIRSETVSVIRGNKGLSET